MRRRYVVPTAAALALSLIPAGPALAASAADTTPPQVLDIAFSESAVTVSGLQTKFVEARVRLTDDTGVQPISYGYNPPFERESPYLRLNAEPNNYILLRLTEGTDKDGIWSGNIPVTSAWRGTITPVQIYAKDKTYENTLDINPGALGLTPTLKVRSSNRPAIDMTFSPEPRPAGKPVTQKIRAWNTTTGKPWPNLPLHLSFDNGCVEPGGLVAVRTRADGTYKRKISAANARWVQCAWVPGVNQPGSVWPPTRIAADAGFARTERYAVTAKPAVTSAKVGKSVKIKGKVSPVYQGKVVQLQRYLKKKGWRLVTTAKVRADGRYTVVATPKRKITYTYRVYAAGDVNAVGGVSKKFKIRGK
ncbi:hypothetical protein [Actinoplanes aureus]|uniref:Uncharacterized protein n=1 Tax=Actinoplanes aureus TaxID=2792083 RepID=A0A931G232_9ACTN|nr:hypothetical protein [Actinoplanes aureus]MBG0568603.1 hypothetical protein [Actinoplanes aureus]